MEMCQEHFGKKDDNTLYFVDLIKKYKKKGLSTRESIEKAYSEMHGIETKERKVKNIK
jgi:hypothetical protein